MVAIETIVKVDGGTVWAGRLQAQAGVAACA
jgi:hypothetical protein